MDKSKFFKYLLIICGIVLLAGGLIIFILSRQSASLDQQIAEFEAKRKIPDSENAAVIYERLFTDANFTEVFENVIYSDMSDKEYAYKPWKSEDHPQAAEWIQSQQEIIGELFDASKFEKCYFPLPYGMNGFTLKMERMRLFRQRMLFIVFALNNDTADGRIDGAVEKFQCLHKMSDHIRQQPSITDYLVSIAVEAYALMNIKSLIIGADISEEQLKRIESFPIQIEEAWSEQLTPELLVCNKFHMKKFIETRPILERIKLWFTQISDEKRAIENARKLYLRLLTDRRANRILIGLKKFKNQNGQWPKSLEQIKSFVDPNILIDPQNGGAFVYKLTETGFTLYSRGLNNIDEEGNRKEPADDWMIWPVGR